MAKTHSLRSFVQSSTIFTLATVLVNFLGYAFHVLSGRYLGPVSYSDITTILAYAIILTVPVTVGSVLIIKRAGSHPDKGAYLQRLLSSFDYFIRPSPLLLALYLGLVLFGYCNRLSSVTLPLMPVFVLTYLLAQLYASLLQAGKLFSPLSLIIIVTGLLKLGGALLAIVLPSPVPILLLLIVSNLSQIWLARRRIFRQYGRATAHAARLTFSLTSSVLRLTFISILGLTLLNNLDIVLAKQFLAPELAGLYGVWSLFAKAITFSFIPLSSVALVFFADADSDLPPTRLLYPSLAFLIFSGVLAYGAFALLSPLLITTLMGPQFSPLIPLLPLAAIFGTVCSLIYLLNNYFLSQNSLLALLPAGLTLALASLIIIWGKTLPNFIQLLTFGSTLLLLLYPTTVYLRTKRAFSPRSH